MNASGHRSRCSTDAISGVDLLFRDRSMCQSLVHRLGGVFREEDRVDQRNDHIVGLRFECAVRETLGQGVRGDCDDLDGPIVQRHDEGVDDAGAVELLKAVAALKRMPESRRPRARSSAGTAAGPILPMASIAA